MLTITAGSQIATIINVFTVKPTDQARLVAILIRATEEGVRQVPGFLSASLHRSLDGSKVAMYAQWQSLEHYQQMRTRPDTTPYLQEALSIATFDPGIYEVTRTFEP